MTDLSIDKLFYLPNMDYEIGLFLKYIISYIASKEIMIDFKNIIIKPDDGCCNIHIFNFLIDGNITPNNHIPHSFDICIRESSIIF